MSRFSRIGVAVAIALVCSAGIVTCAKARRAQPMTLAFAVVVEDGVEQGRDYPIVNPVPKGAASVRLTEPERFEVEDASPTSDDTGRPAVQVELTQADGERFRSWTAQRIERKLALVIDGRVWMIATLQDALPGVVLISGGARGLTAEEAQMLAAGLRAGAK